MDLSDDYINAVIGQGKHDNQSFFAFTATPKGESLELFGVTEYSALDGHPTHRPFHVYSMRQAIEEGFILAKLPCGVAAVYQNEWIQPVLCKVDEFKTGDKQFGFTPDEDAFHDRETKEVSNSLLECIMNNEIFRKDDKADIQKLRHLIIKSKLDSAIKTDFMEYIESNKETAISSLRKMMYDFLSAEDAIESSRKYNDLTEWANSVVNGLQPSIKDYSKKQVDNSKH